MNTNLSIKLTGFGPAGLLGVLHKAVKRVSCPETQSAECTWRLEIIWEGGTAWTVQSVPTMTESGHEMGSLRIEESPESSLPQGFRRTDLDPGGLVVASCRIASASESGVTSDCAIALLDDANTGLVIATAPAPGAVVLWGWGHPAPRSEFDPSSFVWRRASTLPLSRG